VRGLSSPFLEEHLRTLHLPTVFQNYKRLAQGDDARITYLAEHSSLKVNKRHENGVRAKILAAKFPVIKSMESFAFTLQPEPSRRKLTELLDCKFIDEKRNVVFIGTTGVGKTHRPTRSPRRDPPIVTISLSGPPPNDAGNLRYSNCLTYFKPIEPLQESKPIAHDAPSGVPPVRREQ
jgi:hypothetical protein